jgi:hypothetical protein
MILRHKSDMQLADLADDQQDESIRYSLLVRPVLHEAAPLGRGPIAGERSGIRGVSKEQPLCY